MKIAPLITYINSFGEYKAFTPGWNKGRHTKADCHLFIDKDYIGGFHSINDCLTHMLCEHATTIHIRVHNNTTDQWYIVQD
jgi:hypothetical protein